MPSPLIRAVLLFLLAAAQPAAAAAIDCAWTEAAGNRLLERKVGSLSLKQVDLEVAVAKISEASDLPMSFVQLKDSATIDLDLKEASVREALEALIRRAPGYRYGLIGGRLVFYPLDPLWERTITGISLGPGRRLAITRALSAELARQVPELAALSGPWVMGNTSSYTYTDIVSVRAPASLLDLMLQLLGDRPETYIIFDKRPSWDGPSLSVASQDQIRDLRAAAPVTNLRRRGETAQLKVTATLKTGAVKDLAAGACGTVYTVSNDTVLTVSPDGMVTAKANGTAQVTISNEHARAYITLAVSLPNRGDIR
jgi:hypothetical protein